MNGWYCLTYISLRHLRLSCCKIRTNRTLLVNLMMTQYLYTLKMLSVHSSRRLLRRMLKNSYRVLKIVCPSSLPLTVKLPLIGQKPLILYNLSSNRHLHIYLHLKINLHKQFLLPLLVTKILQVVAQQT